jgi:hypothetical protein
VTALSSKPPKLKNSDLYQEAWKAAKTSYQTWMLRKPITSPIGLRPVKKQAIPSNEDTREENAHQTQNRISIGLSQKVYSGHDNQ